ncbi:hypothetical protein CORC01_12274 [Colletotrichum orchidophilum]|uniref:Uncharacterized protein n=1 Tax=Colletotrichum orchidophilum TaxID=1209926 RepID=A0A1G4ATJ8_9PEZI|nr:uncharacterized protein CORC01_12274 [Colletotrichum orchidophilum]OHE92413.1 hypothetical protein CORC01_12274 [Colletotrichum orchidophilum]
MPSLRGIDVSIVPGPNIEGLPELPHPESSSVRLRGPHAASPMSSTGCSFTSTPEKCRPTTSVYIPSSPGSQFHLRYSINKPPANSKFLYFKMTMNGRQVVSWGTRSQAAQSQIVSHALYEPDTKWHYRESGVTYKREGVEKRFFHFVPRSEASAAMDGGLIDVQIFRSHGRRRRAPQLGDFRSQDQYGITSPTGGLVESPQDLTFYDWVLVDPVDSPFATFRFFYRTWENLKALNLVSEAHYDELIASNAQSEQLPNRPITPIHYEAGQVTSTRTRPFDFDSVDGLVFEDNDRGQIEKKGKQNKPAVERDFYLETPPELTPPVANRSRMPQPSKLAREILKVSEPLRTLPMRPDSEPSIRSVSLESTRAPSVTPSLFQYIEESSGGEEFELGIARRVMLPSLSQELPETDPRRPLPSPPLALPASSSDYNMTPPSTGGLEVNIRIGRQEYIAAVHAEAMRLRGSSTSAWNFSGFSSQELYGDSSDNGQMSAIENLDDMNLLEGEWLRRSPSPLRRRHGRLDLNRRNARKMN